MKANEYFKKIGIDAVKEYLVVDGWRNTPFIIQLKRLVASWELVQEFGGLEHAKRFYDENLKCDDAEVLCKAIADVESCQ